MNQSTTLKAAALLIFASSVGLLYVIYLLLPLPCGFWGHTPCDHNDLGESPTTVAQTYVTETATLTIEPTQTIISTPTPTSIPTIVQAGTPTLAQVPTRIEIRVGIAIDRTGKDAPLGQEQMDALKVAEKFSFKPYFCDTVDPTQPFCLRPIYADAPTNINPAIAIQNAKDAFTFLIDAGVDIIIGPTYSQQAEEAHKLAQAAGVPVIAVSNTADGIVEEKDYIFRVSAPVGVYAKFVIVELQNDVDVENIKLIYLDGDPFTASEKRAFEQQIRDAALPTPIQYTYPYSTTDFLPLVAELLTEPSPDWIIISGRYNDSLKLIKQLNASSYKGTLIAGNGMNVNIAPEECKQACEGVYIAQAYNPDQQDNLENDVFVTDSKKAGSNQNPSQIMAQMYTAIQVIVEATKKLTKDSSLSKDGFRDAFKQQLLLQNFNTPLGKIRFDPEGEICQSEFYVAKIENINGQAWAFQTSKSKQTSDLNLEGKCYRNYPPPS